MMIAEHPPIPLVHRLQQRPRHELLNDHFPLAPVDVGATRLPVRALQSTSDTACTYDWEGFWRALTEGETMATTPWRRDHCYAWRRRTDDWSQRSTDSLPVGKADGA